MNRLQTREDDPDSELNEQELPSSESGEPTQLTKQPSGTVSGHTNLAYACSERVVNDHTDDKYLLKRASSSSKSLTCGVVRVQVEIEQCGDQ